MGQAFPLSSNYFKIWLWIPLILFAVSATTLSTLIFDSLLPWTDKTWHHVSIINSSSGMHTLNPTSSTPNHLKTSFINPYGTPSPLRDIWWCLFSWSNIKLCTSFPILVNNPYQSRLSFIKIIPYFLSTPFSLLALVVSYPLMSLHPNLTYHN